MSFRTFLAIGEVTAEASQPAACSESAGSSCTDYANSKAGPLDRVQVSSDRTRARPVKETGAKKQSEKALGLSLRSLLDGKPSS